MEIKDYCDIHGEPICVGDLVKIVAGRSNYIAKGRVHLITKYHIDLINDAGGYEHYDLHPDDEIEIISKFKDYSNVLRGHGEHPWGYEKEAIKYCENDIASTAAIVSDLKKEESKPDMVNHPPHYQSETGIEVIDVIEAFTSDLKGGEATNTGNVIKYILRWPHKKNPLEDLKKARWYIDRLIKLVEKRMEKENA